MTTTTFQLPTVGQSPRARSGEWMAKRGALLVFLQMPVAALVAGYALGLVSFPVATFAVFVSSAAFPAWVSHRITISDDPDEPVHHLHRYALNALVLVAAFTLVLIPAFLAAGTAIWALWYDLGAELTGEPPTGTWSLAAGVVVYGLVAMSVASSYFVLVRRHRMLHAELLLASTFSGLFVYRSGLV
ncbi:MAG: hypothetical protein M3314_15065 [Actinomycetota bacterium]|nr:hypothetical protein [Actinomycetota bacterium]